MTSLHDPRAARRGAGWRWHLTFWPLAVIATVAAVAALHDMATTLYTERVLWLGGRFDTVDHSLARLEHVAPDSPRRSVVFFGDSTVAQYTLSPPLPNLTNTALSQLRGRPWINMINVSAPGAGITQYAFLADHVASFQPDLVIWQLSFFQFTDRWTGSNGAPELVGFVDARRLPEILAMPVERFRLSLADIVLQQGIVRLGLHDVHRSLRESQLRFAHLIELAQDALNPNRGRKPEDRAQLIRGRGYMRRHMDMGHPGRYSANGELVHFGRTLHGLEPDDAKVRLLRSGIEALVDRGVDVLVYLNPTNLDNLRRTGVYDEAGLERTVDVIREAVEASGGHFVTLHTLLHDADFKDAAGHFHEDEIQAVPRAVTTEIARAALPILLEREREERSGRGGRPTPDAAGTAR
jgi:hypothetical protein